jgi:glycosyltransferase involved in cell wall biosynthesis
MAINIEFFLFTDISTGAGTENVTLELIKRVPDDFKVKLVETDLMFGQRISNAEIQNYLKNVRIIKFHATDKYNIPLSKSFYRDFIKRPWNKEFKTIPEKDRKEILDTDIVYLLNNRYASFFHGVKNTIVIASEHNTLPLFWRQKEDVGTLKWFFYKMSEPLYLLFYYKPVNGLHVFPNHEKQLNRLHLKYKMVLPNGVDTDIFLPGKANVGGKLRVFFVSRLIKEKGLDIIIPLADKLSDNPDIEFHIAGTGPLVNEIKNRNNIIYHGKVNNIDLAKLYRECDVFIYPSHNDVYPLVTLEALSSGLYVLEGDYLKGVFDDFEGKYLEYLPMNVEAFYNRINEIINNRDIIKHDKLEEHEYVRNNYDWDIIAQKFYSKMREFYKYGEKDRHNGL